MAELGKLCEGEKMMEEQVEVAKKKALKTMIT